MKKKLELKKESVAALNKEELGQVNGGNVSTWGCVFGIGTLIVGAAYLYDHFNPDYSYNLNQGEQNAAGTQVSCDVINDACVISDVYVCG
ncbi:MAG: class I lanthipeptide [Bacteroidales bacterium]|nr:class I lanthipeptide [Bacteroidales bacterium]MDY0142359.1 class I lanthipeptide [Bacteroidales bacterium]